jgi:MSHA biogenesis protein MshI
VTPIRMLQTVTARFGRIFRKRRRTEGLRAAVAISDTEIAVALVRKLDGQRPKVLRIVVEEAPLGFADPVLKKIIADFDLRRIPVSAVIGASDYQIAQVQAPDVPRPELRAAARYTMRDVFDFPIDNAVVDVFDLPAEANSGAKGTCFAIATRGDAVEQITNTFERHFRRFDVIDIPELCQRNLAALLPQDAKGVAFLLIRDDFAQLVLTRNRMLYVTRRFDFRQRGELNGDADAELHELPLDPQMLSLELQRSLDYYESHFDEGAITDLFIAPAGIRANLMAAELGASTGLRISMFNIHDLVDVSFSAEIPDGWLPCMAIGAAMRTQKG